MNFDEIQKVWDTQNSSPLYVVRRETILGEVKRRFLRLAAWTTLLGVALVGAYVWLILIFGRTLVDRLNNGQPWGGTALPLLVLSLMLAAMLFASFRCWRTFSQTFMHSRRFLDAQLALNEKAMPYIRLNHHPLLGLAAMALLSLGCVLVFWSCLPLQESGERQVLINLVRSTAWVFGSFWGVRLLGDWWLRKSHLPRHDELLRLRGLLDEQPDARYRKAPSLGQLVHVSPLAFALICALGWAAPQIIAISAAKVGLLPAPALVRKAEVFGGIGIRVDRDTATRMLVVKEVSSGHPAEKAGIISRELIAEIDGTPTPLIADADVLPRLRGQPGSAVRLKIVAPATGQTRGLTLTRVPLKQ